MNSSFDSPVARLEMSRHTVDPLIDDLASGAWTESSPEASFFPSDHKHARKQRRSRGLLSWFTGDRQAEDKEPASLVELSASGGLFPPPSWRF